MLEFIMGIAFSWYALIGLFIVAFACEHYDNSGGATIFTLFIGGVAYMLFGLSPVEMGYIALAWIPVGLCWSFWRWRRVCSDKVAEFTKAITSHTELRSNSPHFNDNGLDEIEKYQNEARLSLAESINPKRHTSRITYWIVSWPFSFLETILGDLISMVTGLVTTTFKQTYQRITDNSLMKVDKELDSLLEAAKNNAAANKNTF